MSTGVDKLLRKLFADKEIVFLAHNAKFEYMVLYKHFGIYVKNFKDTFLASKLITAGLEVPKGYNGQFSTASIWCRSFKSFSD
jgi:ribonuclease D